MFAFEPNVVSSVSWPFTCTCFHIYQQKNLGMLWLCWDWSRAFRKYSEIIHLTSYHDRLISLHTPIIISHRDDYEIIVMWKNTFDVFIRAGDFGFSLSPRDFSNVSRYNVCCNNLLDVVSSGGTEFSSPVKPLTTVLTAVSELCLNILMKI